jgi:hypothetical protein
MNTTTLESLLRLAERKIRRGQQTGNHALIREGVEDRQRLLAEASRAEAGG